MGEAAAENSAEGGADFLVRSIRFRIEHSFGGEDHSAEAKAALGGALVDESLLDGMGMAGRAQAFERSDFAEPDFSHWHHARSDDLPADDDGAGAALSLATTEAGTAQAELIVEDEQQRGRGVDVDGASAAVDLEGNLFHRAA